MTGHVGQIRKADLPQLRRSAGSPQHERVVKYFLSALKSLRVLAPQSSSTLMNRQDQAPNYPQKTNNEDFFSFALMGVFSWDASS